MNDNTSATSSLLGFLCVEKTAKEDGFIAALMVTDNRGYPLEFRATTPVRPSLVQKTLYGKQLEHYVGVELCAKALVQQSSRKPKIILVPDRRLLDITDSNQVDVIAIWRAGEGIHIQDDAFAVTRGNIKPVGFQPMTYEGRFIRPDRETEVIAELEDCATRFDLAEAFERIRSALELLAKEDPRYA